MIIDATDLIVGRFATVAAKKAMLGEKVDVINCEKAVITGSRSRIISDMKRKRDRGVPLQGPYFPRMPDRLVRRMIRGMLPYKQAKGAEAFKRVMCYMGVPEGKDKAETIESASIKKLPNVKYLKIADICKEFGVK